MSGYEIGISGLHAAQNSLDIVGNNIANGATEGYHRQQVDLRPRRDAYTSGYLIGQGVDMNGIRRLVDKFLDSQIVQQESTMAQIEKELEALTTMESAFAELTTSAMSTAMDQFFNAMHDLAANPKDVNLQSLVISGAESLSNQMRNLGAVVTELEDLTYSEAITTVEDINLLSTQIAEMNKQIHSVSVSGDNPNNLIDQRDQLIVEMSRLVGVKTYEKPYNVVDVVVGDTTVVLGSFNTDLEAGLVTNGSDYDLGISPAGQGIYNTSISGGRLGGLFSLRNTIVRESSTKLDNLAQTIISETNKLHVQGVGSDGSFTGLTGWTMSATDVSDFVPPVTDGQIYIRITSPASVVTRSAVTVTAATSTLSSVAADFDALAGVTSSVNGGKLQIVADAGYTFDFLPGPLDLPSGYPSGPLAGAGAAPNEAPPVINISGTYSGTTNQTYTCTVSTNPPGGTLAIGNGTMSLTVVDGIGTTVAVFNIGSGYKAGTKLEFDNGLKVSLSANGSSPGYLNDGEDFEILSLANSDTSGFLASVGVNAFFSGTNAVSINVHDDVSSSGSNIAVSRTVEMSDHDNALRMAQLGDTTMTALNGLTPKAYYRDMATDIGAEIATTKVHQENAMGVWRNLSNQRAETSGVDINDEAAKMLLFERMFQSMAKYMSTVTRVLDSVMTIMR